jgi:hypothetical protein
MPSHRWFARNILTKRQTHSDGHHAHSKNPAKEYAIASTTTLRLLASFIRMCCFSRAVHIVLMGTEISNCTFQWPFAFVVGDSMLWPATISEDKMGNGYIHIHLSIACIFASAATATAAAAAATATAATATTPVAIDVFAMKAGMPVTYLLISFRPCCLSARIMQPLPVFAEDTPGELLHPDIVEGNLESCKERVSRI